MSPRALTAQDRSALIRLASSLPVGSEERRAVLSSLKHASEALPFDRFYKELDAIRRVLRSARDHRDLDLAAENIPVYVRGGVSKGFLPKSYESKYNRLLRGIGLKGLAGVDESRDHWLSIVEDMENSARQKERTPESAPKKKWDWREFLEEK